MKKLFFLSLVIFISASAFTSSKCDVNKKHFIDTARIVVNITSANGILKPDNIIIGIEIKNISTTTVRLPDIFNDLQSNIYVSVTSESERNIIPIQISLIDFSAGAVNKYITLMPKHYFKGSFSLSKILKSKNIVLGGIYNLQLCYINNKGVNCVHGNFCSNQLTLNVFKTPQPKVVAVAPEPRTQSVVSNVVTFTTLKDTLHVKPFMPPTKTKNKTGKFTDDRDGQIYTWVKIGKQTWMSQNLNYKTKSGFSYPYDNDSANNNKYGRYYDYAALNDACPKGWHIPTDLEWQQLEIEGGIPATEVNKYGWNGDDMSTFLVGGSTGLNVLFAGQRRVSKVYEENERAYFWTARNVQVSQYYNRREFIRSYNRIMRVTQGTSYDLSIRCVKDE